MRRIFFILCLFAALNVTAQFPAPATSAVTVSNATGLLVTGSAGFFQTNLSALTNAINSGSPLTNVVQGTNGGGNSNYFSAGSGIIVSPITGASGTTNIVSTLNTNLNIYQFGAYGDEYDIPRIYGQAGVTMHAGSPIVNCASANFTSADVGKKGSVLGATTTNDAGILSSIIVSVQNSTNLTLAVNADANTGSGAGTLWYGHDDTPAFLAAIAAETNGSIGICDVPPGHYFIDGLYQMVSNGNASGGLNPVGYFQIPYPVVSSTNSYRTYGFRGTEPPAPNLWDQPENNTIPLSQGGAIIVSVRCPPRTNSFCCYQTAIMGIPYNPNTGIGFSEILPYAANMTFRTAPIPMTGAVNFFGCGFGQMENLVADNGTIAANWKYNANWSGNFNNQTNFNVTAFVFPTGNNQAYCSARNLTVQGFPCAFWFNSHIDAFNLTASACFIGYRVEGNSYVQHISQAQAWGCTHPLVAIDGGAYFVIDSFAWENGGFATANWIPYNMTELVYNPYGYLNLNCTESGYRGTGTFPLVSGISNGINMYDISNSTYVYTLAATNLNISNSILTSTLIVDGANQPQGGSVSSMLVRSTNGVPMVQYQQGNPTNTFVFQYYQPGEDVWDEYWGYSQGFISNGWAIRDASTGDVPFYMEGNPSNTITLGANFTLFTGAQKVQGNFLVYTNGATEISNTSWGTIWYTNGVTVAYISNGNFYALSGGGGGSGTVTSVAMAVDSAGVMASVSGSPITSSGTFTPTFSAAMALLNTNNAVNLTNIQPSSLTGDSAFSVLGNPTSNPTTAPVFTANPVLSTVSLTGSLYASSVNITNPSTFQSSATAASFVGTNQSVNGSAFTGNGSGLTNIQGPNIVGTITANVIWSNAVGTNVISPTNYALTMSHTNVFSVDTNAGVIVGGALTANTLGGNGANLTNIQLSSLNTNGATVGGQLTYTGYGNVGWAVDSSTTIGSTVTYTNFVLNQAYTNASGSVEIVAFSQALTPAAVAGTLGLGIMVSNVGWSAYSNVCPSAESTLLTSIAGMSSTNVLVTVVSNGSSFYVTNFTSGAGNSASVVPSTGTITVIGNAAASGYAALGANQTFTGVNTFSQPPIGSAASLTNLNLTPPIVWLTPPVNSNVIYNLAAYSSGAIFATTITNNWVAFTNPPVDFRFMAFNGSGLNGSIWFNQALASSNSYPLRASQYPPPNQIPTMSTNSHLTFSITYWNTNGDINSCTPFSY